MAEQNIKGHGEIFPEMPEAPEIHVPTMPNMYGSCWCKKSKRLHVIIGLILLAVLIVAFIYYILLKKEGFLWPSLDFKWPEFLRLP